MPWTAHIDGGSRGNPGPAAAGLVLRDENGREVLAAGFFIGRATNNQAEYNGLLRAVELLRRAGARQVEIVSDSELMVRQINGQYKVRSPELRPLYQEALAGLAAMQWRMRHVLREHNRDADGLANQAMDARADVVRVDLLGLLTTEGGGAAPTQGGPAADAPPPASTAGRPLACVEAHVTAPPARGQCPACLRSGSRFVFEHATPPGLCLHLCAAALPLVLELQQNPSTVAQEVRCRKTGCGARLSLRVRPAGSSGSA